MKVIEQLVIKNCFKHKHTTINFEEGLNYIIGPEGSGKTIILEMISFALFGNVALRDVSSSYKKLEVTLYFNYLNSKFKIIRKVNDAIFEIFDTTLNQYQKLVVGTTPVNEKIISLLGYDYGIYILSNYCQQNDLQAFSKMTPAKKTSFIDKISGIEDAKETLKHLELKRKFLKKEIEYLEKLTVLPKEIDSNLLTLDFDKELEILYQKQKDSMLEIQKEQDLKLQSYQLNPELKIINLQIENIKTLPSYIKYSQNFNNLTELQLTFDFFLTKEKELIDLNNQLLTIEQKYTYLPTDYHKYKYDDLIKYLEIKELNEKIIEKNKLLSVGNTTCPNCNHSFDIAHLSLQSYDNLPLDLYDFNLNLTPRIINNIEELIQFYKEDEITYTNLLKKISLIKSEISSSMFGTLKFNVNDIYDLPKHIDSLNQYEKDLNSLLIKIESVKKEISELDLELIQSGLLINNQIVSLEKDKVFVTAYNASLEIYNNAIVEKTKLETELNIINILIKQIPIFTKQIKSQSLPLINYHASKLVNSMTDSVISNITITEDYDIYVDNKNINNCSGSEKDTSSLAFRLSLGNSIITGMMPLFIGDEIDAACREERSTLITDVLTKMKNSKYQIILITHKDTSNFENCNIIDLG